MKRNLSNLLVLGLALSLAYPAERTSTQLAFLVDYLRFAIRARQRGD